VDLEVSSLQEVVVLVAHLDPMVPHLLQVVDLVDEILTLMMFQYLEEDLVVKDLPE
jgi:hypothetical protein